MNTKDELVIEFMDVTGMPTAMRKMFDSLANAVFDRFPEEAEDIRKAFDKIDTNDLVKEMVPLYRHLSEDNLRDMISFYKTETGRKLIELQPTIMKESFAIGQAYAERVLLEAVPQLNLN